MLLGIDPLYWIMMIPVFLLSIVTSVRVKRAFSKYSKVRSAGGKTGADVARQILQTNGLSDIAVQETNGFLGDHYDPAKRVVRLSSQVFKSQSVAALGVAAHETGHAIQHKEHYAPLQLRNVMVPVASIGSNFSWIIIFLGFLIGFMGLVKIGIVLFAAVVIFQLITLPVEFNASARAKRILLAEGILSQDEMRGVDKVLDAAAMTYVAAAASAIVTLLYFLLRAGILGGGGSND